MRRQMVVLLNKNFFVGMPDHWSFYHPGPIEGEVGGILLFRYSVIYVYTWPHLLYLNKNFFGAKFTTYYAA